MRKLTGYFIIIMLETLVKLLNYNTNYLFNYVGSKDHCQGRLIAGIIEKTFFWDFACDGDFEVYCIIKKL